VFITVVQRITKYTLNILNVLNIKINNNINVCYIIIIKQMIIKIHFQWICFTKIPKNQELIYLKKKNK